MVLTLALDIGMLANAGVGGGVLNLGLQHLHVERVVGGAVFSQRSLSASPPYTSATIRLQSSTNLAIAFFVLSVTIVFIYQLISWRGH